MSGTEYTLTKLLWSTTGALAKLTSTLLIFTLIIGGFTLADANMQTYRTSVDSGQVLSYTIDATSGDLQIAVVSVDGRSSDSHRDWENYNPSMIDVKVIDLDSGKTIYQSRIQGGHGFNLDVDRGKYRVEVTNLDGSSRDIIIANSQMDIKALVLFAVLGALTATSFSLLMTILPFLVLVLVFNAVSGYTPAEGTSDKEPIAAKKNKTSRIDLMQTNPGSMLIDITNQDKVFASIAIFFAIISILRGGLSFFFFLFSILAIVRVVRRNSIRIKLTNLLYQRGDVSLAEATLAVGAKKSRHVVETLNFMMLELGYSISYNNLTGVITVTGDLTPYLTYSVIGPVQRVVPETEVVVPDVKSETVTEEGQEVPKSDISDSQFSMSCTYCGTKLPKAVAYCHNCGAKQ